MPISKPASFTSSVGVIAGSGEDKHLLRFLAAYLRSDLATYFLLMRAFQVTCDRNRVTLSDVKEFPFVAPGQHADPRLAETIVLEVSHLLGALESDDLIQTQGKYDAIKPQIDDLIHQYFGLTPDESSLVREANEVLVPSVRPRGYRSINTEAYKTVTSNDLSMYSATLEQELDAWRDQLNGKGKFSVEARKVESSVGHIAVAAVSLETVSTESDSGFSETTLVEWIPFLVDQLYAQRLFPAEKSESLAFLPEIAINAPGVFFVVRPYFHRMWLRRCAMRDARSIVERIHASRALAG